MCKMSLYIIVIAIITNILVYFNPLYATEQWGVFDYTVDWCEQVLLNSSNDRLYLSCSSNDMIMEIDVCSMETLRSFPIKTPYKLCLSIDDNYLYSESISQWPSSSICRIRLIDGCMDSVLLNGHTEGFIMNASGDHIWVCHYTYPGPDVHYGKGEVLTEHPESGLITRISTDPFQIEQTTVTWPLPNSVWYSDYSGDVYQLCGWGVGHPTRGFGVSIGAFDGETIELVGQIKGGDNYANDLYISSYISNWTDDGHYGAIPNLWPENCSNKCSIKVFDTTRTEGFKNFEPSFLLTFNHPITSEILGTEFLKKVSGTDIMWATSDDGNPPEDENRARYVIKINTSTHDYEVFEIPEATSPFGYFDVSADGRILYLTQPEEGSVIKCAPGNNDPICRCRIVTPMPYSGPSPAAIEFDTQGTFDEDGDDLTYHWDFDGDCVYDEPVDDSYTGDPDNPTHEYTQSREYTVNLMVTDNYQGECETSVLVSVRIM